MFGVCEVPVDLADDPTEEARVQFLGQGVPAVVRLPLVLPALDPLA